MIAHSTEEVESQVCAQVNRKWPERTGSEPGANHKYLVGRKWNTRDLQTQGEK